MIRQSALLVTALSTVLATAALAGCHVQMQSDTANQAASNQPPAPPPPPPPAASASSSAQPAAPVPAAPATTNVEMQNGSLKMPGDIVFDTGKASLKDGSGSEAVLDQLKQYLTQNDKTVAVLRIEGHTDNQGTPDANMELSGQRALTIKKWLISHGIDEKRLLAVGFGQTKPLVPNDTDQHRAQNRRTEFKLAETYDKTGKPRPYLGMNPLGGGKEFK